MPTVTEKRKSSRVAKLPTPKPALQSASFEETMLPRGVTTDVRSERSCCFNCNRIPQHTHPRRRSFSEQAWAALLLWEEISPQALEQPICDICYEEMRDILIDRADEVNAAIKHNDLDIKHRDKKSIPLAS
jgi:hypothetical protein